MAPHPQRWPNEVPAVGEQAGYERGAKEIARKKNVRLLTDWMDQPHKAERGSRWFVFFMVLGIAVLLGACSLGTWALFKALFS